MSSKLVEVINDGTTVKEYACRKLHSSCREDEDDAFMVCNLSEIIKKWQVFRSLLPDVQPYYAVKANADTTALSLLQSLGANFDCASKGEIKQLLDMGVSADRIIYANPCKQLSHLSYARSKNINLMTFDNECELTKVKKYYPDAHLVLRIKVDDSKSLVPLGAKFGAHQSEVRKNLETARGLGLNVVGVSFHVGSGCSDASAYYDAVKSAKMVFDQGSALGFNFHLLDVGGGFPGTEDEGTTFKDIALSLNSAIDEYFSKTSGLRIIAEPGRLFSQKACSLICNVIATREIPNEKCDLEAKELYYYVNDGIFNSLGEFIYESINPVPYLFSSERGDGESKCTIWGQTCDSCDIIAKSIMLPKMDVGDWMCFHDMGAYHLAIGSEFNGFKRPVIFYMCPKRYIDYIEKC